MYKSLLGIFLFFFCFFIQTQCLVVGIDLGSEYYKIAVIKAGGMDTVMNDASGRKTPTLLGFKNNERFFGTDGLKLLTKNPKQVYLYPTQFSGKEFDNPIVELQKMHYPFSVSKNETRGTYNFNYNTEKEEYFSPEEILAQIFESAKSYCKSSDVEMRDVVITVPPFKSHFERQAILDAAKIAGINVLSLINDGAAVALGYGIERDFPEPQNIIFFDMGSSSTKVSLANFKTMNDTKKKAQTIGYYTIEGSDWDETLGGREFDRRLALHFAKKASKDLGEDVTTQPKVFYKLLKEANKAKEVLSANQQVQVIVESLKGDYDFKMDVKRTEFEDLCSDLFDRLIKPINGVLEQSGLSLDDIDNVEITGGASRIPKVQQILKEKLNRKVIDRHLNGDEAEVNGATYFAASLTSYFRVKTFKLKDLTLFPISSVITLSDSQNSEDNIKNQLLIKNMNRLGSKKNLSFHTSNNFTITLNYDKQNSSLPNGINEDIARFNFGGLPSKEKYNFTAKPKVSVSFKLDTSGIIKLEKAQAEITTVELVEEKVSEKKKKTKTENKTETENDTETESDPEAENEEKTEEETTDGEKNNEETVEEDQIKEETEDEEKIEEEAEEEDKTNEETEEEQIKEETADEEGETKDEETKDEETKDEETDGEKIKEETTDEEGETKDEETKKKVKTVIKEVQKVRHISLDVEIDYFGPHHTSEEIFFSRKKIGEIRKEEEARLEISREKNSLESFIYGTKDKFENEEISKVSTEEEREEIIKSLKETEDWLYDEGDKETASVYRSKLRELKKPVDKIYDRITEQERLPIAVEGSLSALDATKGMLNNITSTTHNVTEEEKETLINKCEELSSFIKKKSEEQNNLKPWDDPVLTSVEIAKKWQEIEKEAKVLAKKKLKPKKVKKVVNETKIENQTETSEENNKTEDDTSSKEETIKQEINEEGIKIEVEEEGIKEEINEEGIKIEVEEDNTKTEEKEEL